jgi:hypothetical protein
MKMDYSDDAGCGDKICFENEQHVGRLNLKSPLNIEKFLSENQANSSAK